MITSRSASPTPWPPAHVPVPIRVCHTWQVTQLHQLSALRHHAGDLLRETTTADAAGAEAVGRAVLALDEMVSNALRHGAPPATVQLCDQGQDPDQDWLVVVTDSAPDRLPVPAVDRPAGQGGHGLHVITDLATCRGITVDRPVKHVWALLPKT